MKDWMYPNCCWKLKLTSTLAYKLCDSERPNPFVIQFLGRSLGFDILGVKPVLEYCESWRQIFELFETQAGWL